MEQEKYTKKLQPRQVIKCPHCEWEYAPAEVLYADNVIGQPKCNIIKDPLGHILYLEYKEDSEPLAEDVFICENCGKPFVIEIETNYSTRAQEEELDLSNTAVQLW